MTPFELSAGTPTPEEYADAVFAAAASSLDLEAETIPFTEALGRTLAQRLTAPGPMPPFANSQMDGYALTAAAATRAEREFLVGEDVPAGGNAEGLGVDDNTVYPIMTGAPLPSGYSAVVPEERAEPLGAREGTFAAAGTRVRLPRTEPGRFVRFPGEDVAAGQTLAEAGTRLNAAHIGTLAAHGISSVEVWRAPRVLIITGGEEIAADPGRLHHGAVIRDANGPMLTAMVERAGAHVRHLHTGDDPARLSQLLTEAFAEFTPDLVLSSGGISHGKFEVVRLACERMPEVTQAWFGHVGQQPGGPQGLISLRFSTAARRNHTATWIALPGNPVSTLVSYRLFVYPVLRHTGNTEAALALSAPVRAGARTGVLKEPEELTGLADKVQFRRGTAAALPWKDGTQTTELSVDPATGSHQLHRASNANALIAVPAGARLSAGAQLTWYPLTV